MFFQFKLQENKLRTKSPESNLFVNPVASRNTSVNIKLTLFYDEDLWTPKVKEEIPHKSKWEI